MENHKLFTERKVIMIQLHKEVVEEEPEVQ